MSPRYEKSVICHCVDSMASIFIMSQICVYEKDKLIVERLWWYCMMLPSTQPGAWQWRSNQIRDGFISRTGMHSWHPPAHYDCYLEPIIPHSMLVIDRKYIKQNEKWLKEITSYLSWDLGVFLMFWSIPVYSSVYLVILLSIKAQR